MIPCPFCEEVKHVDKTFMFHIRLKHKEYMMYEVTCKHFNCSRTFQNIHSYKKHYISNHTTDQVTISNEKCFDKDYKSTNSNNTRDIEQLEEFDGIKIYEEDEIKFATSAFFKDIEDLKNLQNFTQLVYKYVALIVLKI